MMATLFELSCSPINIVPESKLSHMSTGQYDVVPTFSYHSGKNKKNWSYSNLSTMEKAFRGHLFFSEAMFFRPIVSVLCILTLLVGCNRPSMRTELDTYEQDIEREPKATYELLKGKQPVTDEDRARHALLTIKAKNLAYIPLEAKDTAAIMDAIDYYRQQKDSRQVMLGYYLLGSIYRDLGDAPRGVEAFHQVIEEADTTNKDCDYRIMARAEGQKSNLQRHQIIYTEAIESSSRAEYYAWQARDTSYAFDCAFGIIAIHVLQKNYKPLVNNLPELVQQCLYYGDTLLAVKKIIGFAWSYVHIGMTDEAEKMIALYDRHNGRGYPIYYGTKGELSLVRHQLDSAEWFFRKELEATDWNNRQTAYRGLKKVFEQRHQTDSALKYATLQCEAVDSDYQHKVSDAVIEMEHVYNYGVEKDKVRQSEMARQRTKWILRMTILAFVFAALMAAMGFMAYRERQKRKRMAEFAEREALRRQVEATNRELAAQQTQMDKMQNTIEEYREEAIALENLGDGVKQMRRQLELGKHATTRNWEALQKQVVKAYPGFIKALRQLSGNLTESDLRLAMLIKTGFLPGEIATLMDKSPSGISMARTRLYQKCCGEASKDAQAVDEWIKGMGG